MKQPDYLVSTSGNTSYAYGEADMVTATRRAFFQEHGIDEVQVCFSKPAHGIAVMRVGQGNWGRAFVPANQLPEADILLVETGTFAGFNPADCAVIGLSDSRRQSLAMVHAGAKGVEQEVPRIGIETLLADGSRIEDIDAWISPCLQHASFILRRESVPLGKGWEPYMVESGDPEHPVQVDYPGRIVDQLRGAGIDIDRIRQDGRDTMTDASLFSDVKIGRGLQTAGRFMVIGGFRI